MVQRVLSSTTLSRLAAVGFAVTTEYARDGTPNERRLLVTEGLRGAGSITATGTPTDPTTDSATLNEFEIGGAIGLIDYDSDDREIFFGLNAQFYFQKNMAGVFEFRTDDFVDAWSLGMRFYF